MTDKQKLANEIAVLDGPKYADNPVTPTVKGYIVNTGISTVEVYNDKATVLITFFETAEPYQIAAQAVNLDRKYRNEIESKEIDFVWSLNQIYFDKVESA